MRLPFATPESSASSIPAAGRRFSRPIRVWSTGAPGTGTLHLLLSWARTVRQGKRAVAASRVAARRHRGTTNLSDDQSHRTGHSCGLYRRLFNFAPFIFLLLYQIFIQSSQVASFGSLEDGV